MQNQNNITLTVSPKAVTIFISFIVVAFIFNLFVLMLPLFITITISFPYRYIIEDDYLTIIKIFSATRINLNSVTAFKKGIFTNFFGGFSLYIGTKTYYKPVRYDIMGLGLFSKEDEELFENYLQSFLYEG